MRWLGLDIGGANLKLADGHGFAVSRYFPLWQRPDGLAAAIGEALRDAPEADGLAVTMTGELADCFETKRQGVAAIIDATTAATTRQVKVYLTDGRFVDPDAARADPLLAAAANWHALASYAGRWAPRGAALLIDVGSTTTDLVPLLDGRPVPQGLTDPQRLVSGELVYTGVQRTPVCAVVSEVPWQGAMCPTAAELFATTWDAYLILGDLPEEPDNTHTADGRPATKSAARGRLARSICADREMFDDDDAAAVADAIGRAQLAKLTDVAGKVMARLPQPPKTAIVSGSGQFLARRLADALGVTNVIGLSQQIGVGPSHAAAAHAVAVLAGEDAGKLR